jgi:DNA replication protein DnaC
LRLTPEEQNLKVLCGLDCARVPSEAGPVRRCESFIRLDGLYDHLTHPCGSHKLEPEQARRAVEERASKGVEEAREAEASAREAVDREWKRVELHRFRSQAPPRAKDWTLDTFPAADVAGRRALKAARRWTEGEAESHPRVLIHGSPASGKTGLACGVARHWLSQGGRRRAVFENVRALLEAQKARFASGQGKALDHLLIERRDAHGLLIVIDDLGAGRQTEFAVETAALIIEHLHALNVPLIVTTNYAPDELARRLGHADPIEGLRIVSRLCEDARVIPLDRPDLRLRKAGVAAA